MDAKQAEQVIKKYNDEADLIDRVALAINKKWNEISDAPFPLYQQEAEELARAAIAAVSQGNGD